MATETKISRQNPDPIPTLEKINKNNSELSWIIIIISIIVIVISILTLIFK